MYGKFDNTINSICETIKTQDFVIGIVLFGSIAKGTYHSASDIDLYVFCKKEMDKEVFLYKNEIPVHVRYSYIESFKDNIMIKSRRLPDVLGNKVYYDPTNVIHEYLEKSRVLIEQGPLLLSNDEKTILRGLLHSEPQIVKGMIEAGRKAEAVLLMNEILNSAISAYYDANTWWMPNNNTLIGEIKKLDAEMGGIAENIILENDPRMKLEKLINFCNSVLEVMGGPLLEYEIVR